ncbi:MAG: PilW family protein [Acidiferrobacter sp.]
MSISTTKGFTLIELMIAMVIGALLVLAAMFLYVPVSRSLIDQGVIGQQTATEAMNYDFDVMNSANAGYGVLTPQVNTDVVLVTGTGPGNNTAVPIPASGSAQGNGLFWDWVSPISQGVVNCAGLEVVASANPNPNNTNDRLVYYEQIPTPGQTCTAATAMNSATAWDAITVLPSIATNNTIPAMKVVAAQNCDLRGSQFIGNPVTHPLVVLQLPIATTLTGGFFSHSGDSVPVAVCLRNLP